MKVVDRVEIAPNVHACKVSAPDIAKKVKPGQFIIVIPDQYSERTPITVANKYCHLCLGKVGSLRPLE